jgi:hypothetical protein
MCWKLISHASLVNVSEASRSVHHVQNFNFLITSLGKPENHLLGLEEVSSMVKPITGFMEDHAHNTAYIKSNFIISYHNPVMLTSLSAALRKSVQ